ncbi:MAG: hypothetical protein AAFR70_14485 [Pseudomonadota bacterium]
MTERENSTPKAGSETDEALAQRQDRALDLLLATAATPGDLSPDHRDRLTASILTAVATEASERSMANDDAAEKSGNVIAFPTNATKAPVGRVQPQTRRRFAPAIAPAAGLLAASLILGVVGGLSNTSSRFVSEIALSFSASSVETVALDDVLDPERTDGFL